MVLDRANVNFLEGPSRRDIRLDTVLQPAHQEQYHVVYDTLPENDVDSIDKCWNLSHRFRVPLQVGILMTPNDCQPLPLGLKQLLR